MDRRHFLWTTVFTSSLSTLARGADEPAPKPTEKPVEKPVVFEAPKPGLPTVAILTADSVSIVWSVNGSCTGYVEYGPTEAMGKIAYGAQDGLRPFDATVLSLRIPGLKPGEKIFYRTLTAPVKFPNHYSIKRGEAVASPAFEFVVPGASDKARIAVWNDVHEQKETVKRLGEVTNEFAPDLLVLNGDLVDDQFNKENDFVSSFLDFDGGAEAWSKRLMAFVRGNHDARGSIARELPRYAPRPHPEGYYGMMRLGPISILRLDTGDDKEGAGIYGEMGDFAAYREQQRAWLEQAIVDPAFATAPFKLLFCHIPLRWKAPASKGAWCSDGDARWSPLLAKAKIHAVISGHTHDFWHDVPNAERPFHQIVSGGPTLQISKRAKTPACVIKIEANLTKLDLRVVEATSGTEHLHLELNA